MRGAGRGSKAGWFLARAIVLAALLAAWLPRAARAQASPGRWRVSSSPLVDLWARGVALAHVGGGGELPLHAPAATDSTGSWAVLAREFAAVAPLMARDSAFEVLHFASLLVFDESPVAALQSLAAPAGGSPAVMRTRAALEQSLPDAAERRALAGFLRALDRGWRNGGADAWNRDAAARAGELARLETSWRATFVPALGPFLGSIGVRGGMILVQPAIGRDGRILDDGTGMMLVVVGDARGDGPLLAAVRELCFPLVRRALADAAMRDDAVVTDRAAVRCGAMVLERRLPQQVRAYEALYGVAGASALAARFPIPSAAEPALRLAVQRAAGPSVAQP